MSVYLAVMVVEVFFVNLSKSKILEPFQLFQQYVKEYSMFFIYLSYITQSVPT